MTAADLPAKQRIVLSIDTSDQKTAQQLAALAQKAGARFIKIGLELSSATSWSWCSQLAGKYKLDWIADAKLNDIPNTVAGAVNNLAKLDKPPYGITMCVNAGLQAMRIAQNQAGDIIMFGVTVLTSIGNTEAKSIYHTPLAKKVSELADEAQKAGLLGLVCSAQEVSRIKQSSHLITLVPGVRSAGADQADQARVATPAQAIKSGADLLVIGRQVTQAADPAREYQKVVSEIESALQIN